MKCAGGYVIIVVPAKLPYRAPFKPKLLWQLHCSVARGIKVIFINNYTEVDQSTSFSFSD